MGVLSDWFVATEEEARAADPDELPEERFPTVAMKSVEDVKLSTLEEIVASTPYDDAIAWYLEHGEVSSADHGECGITRVRPQLVGALAAADDVAFADAIRRWSRTAEWEGGLGPLSDDELQELVELMRAVRDLARRAVADGNQLFIWWSL